VLLEDVIVNSPPKRTVRGSTAPKLSWTLCSAFLVSVILAPAALCILHTSREAFSHRRVRRAWPDKGLKERRAR
jgi:hypothetical protein